MVFQESYCSHCTAKCQLQKRITSSSTMPHLNHDLTVYLPYHCVCHPATRIVAVNDIICCMPDICGKIVIPLHQWMNLRAKTMKTYLHGCITTSGYCSTWSLDSVAIFIGKTVASAMAFALQSNLHRSQTASTALPYRRKVGNDFLAAISLHHTPSKLRMLSSSSVIPAAHFGLMDGLGLLSTTVW